MSGRYYSSLTINPLTIVLILWIDNYGKCALGLECPQHQLCVNQSGVSSNLSKYSSNALLSISNQSLSNPTLSPLTECSCNPDECHIYGDCCVDVDLDMNTSLFITRYSCLSLLIGGADGIKQMYFYAVSKCSRLWRTQTTAVNNDNINSDDYNNFNEIKSNCEGIVTNQRDMLLTVPIANRITNTTYRNIYCAVCNFDVENTEAFQAKTFCHKTVESNCFLTFNKPLSYSMQSCNLPNLIDSCDAEPHTENEILDCSLHLAPIKHRRKSKLYKNKYCAKCNNISAEQTICPEKVHKSQVTITQTEFTFSFSVLLDINIKGGAYVGAKSKCEESHIFDPWKKICRRVYCKENSVLKDGKCVFPDKRVNHSLNPFEICPKIIIEPEEYRLLSNGFVYLISSNRSYNSSQYEIDSYTNQLKICVNSDDNYIENKFHYSQSYITIGCLLVSITSLVIKFVLFFVYGEKPRRLSSILVILLSLSLICAQLLFLFGINRIEIPIICQLIAILIHYFFLASFFWMSVLSYDIYRVFSTMQMRHKNRLIGQQLFIYAAYGWGLPLIVILAAVVVDLIIPEDKGTDGFGILGSISPSYGTTHCWIANRLALNIFFAAPLAILLVMNSVLLILTAIKISSVSSESRIARENIHRRNERFRFVLYMKLATIMGITWIIGFVAAYAEYFFMWTLFIVFNSLQGLYILLAFTNFTKLNLLRCCPNGGTTRRTSSKTTSISSAVVTRL